MRRYATPIAFALVAHADILLLLLILIMITVSCASYYVERAKAYDETKAFCTTETALNAEQCQHEIDRAYGDNLYAHYNILACFDRNQSREKVAGCLAKAGMVLHLK